MQRMNLGGPSAGPVAEALTVRAIPFVILTGNGAVSLPESYQSPSVLSKPTDPPFGQGGEASHRCERADKVRERNSELKSTFADPSFDSTADVRFRDGHVCKRGPAAVIGARFRTAIP